MINPKELCEYITSKGVGLFVGVPDSLMKEFCSYISDNLPPERHRITANEGAAVAMATGHYLATGKPALVYMQNSGLGNAANPLLSLADEEVYSIPMVLMVGWRGEPGMKDEPQHAKQGKLTLRMIESFESDHAMLGSDFEEAKKTIDEAFRVATEHSCPYFIVVKEKSFEKYSPKPLPGNEYNLTREEAIGNILRSLGEDDVMVSTTGKISREVFEYRKRNNQDHSRDFLTIGAMGHSNHVAAGIAMSKPNVKVYNLDGDGSVIMHMGSMAVIGTMKLPNLIHIILNNGSHESVGGQPTAAFEIDLPKIAIACGYKSSFRVTETDELRNALEMVKSADGPVLLEIRLNNISRPDLGRPDISPIDTKKLLMEYLKNA